MGNSDKPFEKQTPTEQADSFIADMIEKDSNNKMMNIWMLDNALKSEPDQEYLTTIFPKPKQLKFIRGLVSLIVEGMEFHDTCEESHEKTIHKDITKLIGQFRNHRHDFSKNYTGKSEY